MSTVAAQPGPAGRAGRRTKAADVAPPQRARRRTARAGRAAVSAGAVLRALLDRPTILEQPSICDPLTARLAQDAGYEAVSLAGYAIGAHLPLSGTFTHAEVVRATSAVTNACSLPVLVDADADWGGVRALPEAVRRIEAAGAAAVQLSSQHLPDAVPFSDTEERRRAHDELVARVRTAAAARRHLVVTARYDLASGDEYALALERVRELADAGAEAVVVHASQDADLRRLPADLSGIPLIYAGDPGETCGRSVFSPARLQDWGYRGVRNKYHRCYCARMLGRRPISLAESR